MADLLNQLVSHALEAVNQGDAAAVVALFLVAAFTEMGIPFPFLMDTVLFATGFSTGLSFQVAVLMATLMAGRLVGAGAIYLLSRLASRPFIGWLCRRFGGMEARLNSLTGRLASRAPLAVATMRLTPGLLTPASVAAGFVSLRYPYFAMGIAISSIVADAFLVIAGLAAQHGIRLLGVEPALWQMMLALAVFLVLSWLGYRLARGRRKKRELRAGS